MARQLDLCSLQHAAIVVACRRVEHTAPVQQARRSIRISALSTALFRVDIVG